MDSGRRILYGPRVRISNWFDQHESYPLDNSNPNYSGSSHYRTFGLSNQVYIPKTSTQELLDSGLQQRVVRPKRAKPQVTFVSYPDFRFKVFDKEKHGQLREPPLSTTYLDGYKEPKPLITKPDCCKDNVLDPLLNRLPKSDFEMLPSSTHKFMDDHFTMLSEGRKKINFLRQIRNSTYFMGEKKL